MLSNLPFALRRDSTLIKTSGTEVLGVIVIHLAESVSSLEQKGIIQLVKTFEHFGYRTKDFPFRDVLNNDITKFLHLSSSMTKVFHYVAVCGAVGEAWFMKLRIYIPPMICHWKHKDISFLMMSLALPKSLVFHPALSWRVF